MPPVGSRITVGVDVSPLYSGHRVRGIGFYTQRLLEELKKLPRLKIVELKNKEELKEEKYDLLHIPYFSPFFVTLPLKSKRPFLVTVHDLVPVKYPDHYPPGVKGKISWQIQKALLRKAARIVTDSFASKKDIGKYIGFSKEKIDVVYLAAGKEFREIKDGKKLEKVKRKYHLPEEFVLYVGDVNWNKNIPGLARACRRIKLPLIVVGSQAVNKEFDRAHPENKDLVWLQKEIDGKSVIALGFVETEELVAVYNLATIYCQPSYDEGFGLPLLEAMACGCPVVSSRRGSLSEVVGEAGLLVGSTEKELSRGMKRLISDKKEMEKLAQKGIFRAKKFSWKKAAGETARAYEKIFLGDNKAVSILS